MASIIGLEVFVKREYAAQAFKDCVIAGLSSDPMGLLIRESSAIDVVDSVVEFSWASRAESMITQIATKLRSDYGRTEVTPASVSRALDLGVRFVDRKIKAGALNDKRWVTGSHSLLSRLPSMGMQRGFPVGGPSLCVVSDLPESLSQLLLERAGFTPGSNYRLFSLDDRATAFGRVIGSIKPGMDPSIEYVASGFDKGDTLKLAFDDQAELSRYSSQLASSFAVEEILVDRSQPLWSQELERKLLSATVTA